MDNEKRKTLESLGWSPEMLDALKRTPDHASVDRTFQDRAQKALSAAGYSALEVLVANPRISMVELAKRMNRGVSTIGLTMAVYDEAMKQGVVRQVAKQLLIRELLEQFPSGWASEGDIHPLVRIGNWHSEIVDYTHNPTFGDYADRVVRHLTIDSPPQLGWTPQWPNDPLIDELFDRCWPLASD